MFLLFMKQPKDVLMIGLGGGSIAKYIHHFMPEMMVRVVEINPRIIQVARSHFYLQDNDETLEVIEGNGVTYLQENPNTTDVLLLDIFDSQGVPPEMYNQSFFDDCAESLHLDGMMAVNLWGSDRNFDIYLQRIEQSFHGRVLVLRTGRPGNIVVFGFKRLPRDLRWSTLRVRSSLSRWLGIRSTRGGVDCLRLLRRGGCWCWVTREKANAKTAALMPTPPPLRGL